VNEVVITRSTDETRALGERLGRTLAAGDTVAIVGELGAGKTAFVQGLARGLGITSTISSPTFTIVKEHDGRVPLFHVDFYRVEHAAELANIGFDDYFERGGVVAVEWADRFWEALPRRRVDVRIELVGADERRVQIESALQ